MTSLSDNPSKREGHWNGRSERAEEELPPEDEKQPEEL